MDEQYTIREALLNAFMTHERIDETNAITLMREAVAAAGVLGWNIDELIGDDEASEKAFRLIGWVLA